MKEPKTKKPKTHKTVPLTVRVSKPNAMTPEARNSLLEVRCSLRS